MKALLNSRFLLIVCVLFFLSAACTMPLVAQPTTAPDTANTLAAQTISAMLTQPSGATAVPGGATAVPGGATAVPGSPATQAPQNATLRPSSTPLPTATTISIPTATSTPACDRASFISDLTVADGTSIPVGTEFVKSWRLRNEGVCTWTPDYAIVFDKGEAMGAPASQKLGQSVAPGQTIDISVTLRAPGIPADYRGDWKLRNAAGVLFGLGANSSGHFYVVIKAIPSTITGNGLDMTANYCLAEWTANGKSVPCIGTDGSADGFVLYRSSPQLESGYVDDEPALLTNPPRVNDGVIRGKYPAYTVKTGDHFTTLISCENNAKNCNVRFQLDYQIDDGGIQTLAAWNESYDNKFNNVNADLTSLAGKKVKFILTVLANGASDNDRALWLMPRIQSGP